jgi:hypothetical protein
MAFDRTGFWRLRGEQGELLPWNTLDGVGIQPVGQTGQSRARSYSLEVRRRGESHGERIDIKLCHSVCERALWRWVPEELLFGDETRI